MLAIKNSFTGHSDVHRDGLLVALEIWEATRAQRVTRLVGYGISVATLEVADTDNPQKPQQW